MKKFITTFLLAIILTVLSSVFEGMAWWEYIIVIIGYVFLIYVVAFALALEEDNEYIYSETDDLLLAFHPYYNTDVKSVKVFGLNGYAVMIVSYKHGEDDCFLRDPKTDRAYTTLRKDNPMYEDVKMEIERRGKERGN